MVLGLRSKHRRGAAVKVNYIVHIQEIRPWPPLESLRSVQTVLLQWENGNHNSGSFLASPQYSKIVFNESFKLPLILYQDKKAQDKFQRNYLEFSLFVPRKDKASKGQLLGTAVINLADYGVIEHTITINSSIHLKKSSYNKVQPALIISLEPVEDDSSNSSPNVGLSKQASLDNDIDDSEIASFTDDDASSQSSNTACSSTFDAATSSPSQIEKNGDGHAGFDQEQNMNVSDTQNDVNDNASFSKFCEQSMTSVEKNSDTPFIRSSPSSISWKSDTIIASSAQESISDDSHEVIGNTQQSLEEKSFEGFAPKAMSTDNYRENADADDSQEKEWQPEDVQINDAHVDVKNVEANGLLKHCGSNLPRKKGELGEVIERNEPKGELFDCKNEWETRIEMLEEELREAAAIEVGLYSVVAEHTSSGNKVHAPARRLSRFYSNACREGCQAKRASAARAAVSGLVLVSKSCGNDVPRLTFWLSNTIMLRAIVSQTAADLTGRLPHNWEDSSHVEGELSKSIDESDDHEDVSIFIIALEKVESWIFSRIVESVWWQTFTPHMMPTVAKGETSGKRKNMSNHEQGSFSTELWNKAFKDACEKLCPVRAGGHECGCLSVLVRLVMEELVNRLDMAMFNAILRESGEEMPTDPLSDPISDSKVLPIPPGKSGFAAGVELKNSIGNWSRWLTDLFGLEDDSTDILGDDKRPKSFKAFRLLHALSDLMMLPFGVLADVSTRKEVCPMFGPTIIKRVLNSFVPDEFSPDPIPQDILDALDTEEVLEASGDVLTSIPCMANPTKYSPPPAALLTCVGEVGHQVLQSSRLSTLRKSYASDDELDELDSPLTSIIPESFQSSALAKLNLMPKEKGGTKVLRYQLLREIWKDDE